VEDAISSYNVGKYGHDSQYYTTTCFGPGYWPSSDGSQLVDQLYNVRRVYNCGRGVDQISSYDVGSYGHASQYYTITCFGPEYWTSSDCSQLIDQIYNMRRALLSGGDEISSYNVRSYGSQYYTTTCFGPGYWPSSGFSQLTDQL